MAFDFPDSPSVNDVYSQAGRTWIWDGIAWNAVTLEINTRVSATAPADPSIGDTWFDTNTAKLFVYYDDFWVETAAGTVGPPGVVAATSPLSYDSNAQSLSIDLSTIEASIATKTSTGKAIAMSIVFG